MKDARDVVEQAKYLLLSKNEGNLLQDFIWQTQKIEGGNVPGVKTPVDQDARKQHGNEALEGLRTLGTLLISNGQFRKLRKLNLYIACEHYTDIIFSERCYYPRP